MEIDASAAELAQLVVALALSGTITGLPAGLFRVGGGAVIIYFVFF
jgi:hypothetical protein